MPRCWVSERSLDRRADVLPRFAVLAATRNGSSQEASRGTTEAMPLAGAMEGYLRTNLPTIPGWVSAMSVLTTRGARFAVRLAT